MVNFRTIRSIEVSDTISYIHFDPVLWLLAWSSDAHTYDHVYNFCLVHLEHRRLVSFQRLQSSKKLCFFDLPRRKTEANSLVFSIPVGACVHFCTQAQLNCLKTFCFKRSYWVARSWVILGPSGSVNFSEVIFLAVLTKKEIT